MSSNIQVSSDIDTLLKKSTKEEVATFLGLEDTKAQWGQITGSLSSQTDLVNILNTIPSASDVATNNSKVGITTVQANAIVANTSKVGITSSQASAIVANTSKVGITQSQADAIVANTAKVGITTAQATAISTNSQDLATQSQAISDNANDLAIKAPKASPTFTGTSVFEGSAGFIQDVSMGNNLEVYDKITTGGKVGVGIGTGVNPSAMLEVGGTIKADDININSKAFYVDGTNSYIQAEKYGEGTFATLTGSENQPKTTPAFGDNGKVVENTYIKTFKIVGDGFVGLGNNPSIIVTKAGVGKYIVPQRMTVYNDYGTRSGSWGSGGAVASIQIGTFQNSNNTGNFASLLTVPQSTANTNGDWLTHKTIRNSELKQFANRDLCLKSLNNISSEANAPDGAWYVRLEYLVIGESVGFENNIDQTIGTPFA